jgi:hypothetical protein
MEHTRLIELDSIKNVFLISVLAYAVLVGLKYVFEGSSSGPSLDKKES